MKIAIEGYAFVFAALGLSAVGFVLGWTLLGLVGAGFAVFFLWFFRDPDRQVPQTENVVVAPADGKVVSIATLDKAPLLEGRRTRVSIFMSPVDVHINRMPVTGTIDELRHQGGRYLAAYKDDAVEHNEQNALRIKDTNHNEIGVVQVAGFLARRIVCKVREGDRLERGQRFGLIMFGSRTDLYLPADAAVEVEAGQKVKGGETIVGRIG